MWSVYVLLCEDGSFYTGITNNLSKRFEAHQQGLGAKYTRSHKPVKIVFEEPYDSRSEALKREYQIKLWSREEKISNLKLQ